MKIALIADNIQATVLIRSSMVPDQVLSLCPTASYELKKAGYRVISSADYYGSLSHAKTAVIVTRQADIITACGAESYGLYASEHSGFRANVIYILSTLYYFYYSTRHWRHAQAEFISCSKTGIETHGTYEAAFAALMDYALRRYNHTYENTNYSMFHYRIARICNRVLYRYTCAGASVRALHFNDGVLQQIEQALARAARRLVIFRPRAIGKTWRQTCLLTVKHLFKRWRGKEAYLPYFRNTLPQDYRADFSVQTAQFAEALGALRLHFPLPIFFERVVADSGWYMSFLSAQYKVGKNIADELRPHLTMTNKGKYHFIRAAIAHMPKDSGISMLINHGTHTAQPPHTVSQVAANLWGSDDRICLYNVDYVVPRLPLTITQLEQIYPPPLPQFFPQPIVKRIERRFGNPQDKLKIVFAGNYIGTLSHIPWCAETADEYLLNILELIENIGRMKRVEFIIKLKARKARAHLMILQERIDALGFTGHVRIDTETRFLDVLADTHLLISNMSTTIEEALANRVPVLLHTHRKRYFHLPCAFQVEGSGVPGYVYGIKNGQHLESMIEAIRTHYQRIVESDAGLDGIIWRDEQYKDTEAFARQIVQLADKCI